MIVTSLAGLPAFAIYFVTAVALSAIFVVAYTWLTPNREIDLIRQGDTAASIEVGMALIGFALPLSSAIYHSANLIDCVVWGFVAFLVQLLCYWVARLSMPGLAKDIAENHVSAAIWVGSISIAGGILSAASMSY